MSFAERFIVKAASYLLPEQAAYRLARAALATQGIGWAGPASGVRGSGEASFLKREMAKIRKPCIFDVGANVGEYARAALRANPEAIVHCFEPSPTHFQILKGTLTDSNVRLNAFGLSNIEEVRALHKDSAVSGLASLIARDLSHLDISLHMLESVSLMVGDNYVAQNHIDRIDLLKIDVEGWEMSVLKGFEASFQSKLIRCCQFEFGHAHIERKENFRDFYRFFVGKGFKIGALKPNGKVKYTIQYDEIFENYYATNYVATLVAPSD